MRTKVRNFRLCRVSWLLVFLIPFFGYGCNRTPQSQNDLPQKEIEANSDAANNSSEPPQSGSKPNEPSIQQRIQFNLNKLKDRSYTDTYGHNYTWYTAAEELGKIGKPAVPHLIKKLNTQDQYELKLALYALLLATQDSKVKKMTGGEHINLTVALSEAYNEENKRIALRWWRKHKHIFKDISVANH